MRRHLSTAVLLALLAGCARQGGPVFGEWRSQTGGREALKTVDLVLDGDPGATSGTYHIMTTLNDPTALQGHGTRTWGGPWTRQPRVVGGQSISIVTLHDHLADDIGDYALMPDGRLHVLGRDGLPDMTPAAALYTLSPVQPVSSRGG